MGNIVICNLMAHDVHIYGESPVSDGPVFVYPCSGMTARIIAVELGTIQGPELWYEDVGYGNLEQVPDVEEGVFYIVSLVVAIVGRERGDLLAPYKKLHNNGPGDNIIRCRYLQRVR
jgi:hypothetical protein